MSLVRREIRLMTRLATPVALTQLSSMALWTIDFLMVGRVSVTAFNAVSLGRLWVMGSSIVALGFIFGLDPIATQAHGARDRERLGETLLHGATLAVLAALPVGALWLLTGPVLLAFGQDPATVAIAVRYVRVQLPALPFFLLFMVVRQYLQARGIVRPAMWIAFGSIVVNAGLNALLIFGLWGLPRLEAVGAGVATAITQVLMLVALLLSIRWFRLQRGARTLVDPRRVRRAHLAEIARYGGPLALQLAMEYWAFAIASLWAGRLGAAQLAAHSIALNLAAVSYMVPLGISSAATTRVGNKIGAGDPEGAHRAGNVALALGAVTMLGFASIYVAGRHLIPLAFTGDRTVVAMTAAILPILAAFELFDGLQGVGGGVLRGMGATRMAAFANLIGYYVFGLPLGYWLGQPSRLGLAGIWWGLALGLFGVAATLVIWIRARGPRSASAIAAKRTG